MILLLQCPGDPLLSFSLELGTSLSLWHSLQIASAICPALPCGLGRHSGLYSFLLPHWSPLWIFLLMISWNQRLCGKCISISLMAICHLIVVTLDVKLDTLDGNNNVVENFLSVDVYSQGCYFAFNDLCGPCRCCSSSLGKSHKTPNVLLERNSTCNCCGYWNSEQRFSPTIFSAN